MKLKTEFQDENFKLGEVADVNIATMPDGRIKAQAVAKSGGIHTFFYDDLKTFTNDWKDYEEPKDYYFIRSESLTVGYSPISNTRSCRNRKEIGNYFRTKEEAKNALEELKAWKRLKESGVKIVGWCYSDDVDLNGCCFNDDDFIVGLTAGECDQDDLDLFFGGEDGQD